jgi:hypothetical protein
MDYRNGNNDIYFQQFYSNGMKKGVNIKVNDDTGSSGQANPSIAMDAAGNFVIAREDYRNDNVDIYFQRYNSNGVMPGINIKANNDFGTASQNDPSVAIDGTGNFVIAWHDYRNNNFDIYFQRYDSNGAAQGTNIKVNDDSLTVGQYNASVASDILGNIVVAWVDYRNNDDEDIYFQRYNANGNPEGFNTKVNDDTGVDGQFYPSVAMDETGNFIIVWTDNRYVLSKSDIMAQRFYSSGNPWGTNYIIVLDGINHGEAFAVVAANTSQIVFSWMDNRHTILWDIYGKLVLWNWNGVTVVEDNANNNPKDFSLSQNYPNPFNPSTKISYRIPALPTGQAGSLNPSKGGTLVTLKVYDLLGSELATLVNEEKSAGTYEVEFNAEQLSSGIYFYQLKAGDFIQTKKMVLIR